MVKIYVFESDEHYYGKTARDKFDKWQKQKGFKREQYISVTMEKEKIVVAIWIEKQKEEGE